MERSRAQSPTPRRGRPRSTAADDAIADATLALLRRGGFAALTMEAVAAEAGISKHTLYRRASSPADLVIALVDRLDRETVAVPDTGTLTEDLALLARGVAHLLTSSPFGAIVPSLVGAMAHAPELAAAATDYLKRRRALVRQVFERAIARGELAPDADPDLLLDLLLAPFYFRRLVSQEPIDKPFVDAVVAALLDLRRN